MDIIDYDYLNKLDIHSVHFIKDKLGTPDGRLMVSVEQGIIDAGKCRTTISHCFYADSIAAAIPIIMARAEAFNGVGKLLAIKNIL